MNTAQLTLILAVSLAINVILSAILGVSYAAHDKSKSETAHLLAQRVSVLDVEGLIETRQPWTNEAERRGYAELIVDAAAEFGKNPIILAKVALAESALNHRAIGDSGRSVGVMQIQRLWVGHVPFVNSERDLRKASTNIRAGAWILRHYADRCGESPQDYLACYNGGERPNQQAREYARRVAGGSL
jgi:soluble lytic murein transglycosylase-like protein